MRQYRRVRSRSHRAIGAGAIGQSPVRGAAAIARNRLAALQRTALEQTAKAEVSNEQQLVQVPGMPGVVAVLPLAFSGSDTSLTPGERGLAELLTTDLARSSRLTVVERIRLQAVWTS